MNQELLEELQEMMENGCGLLELFEYLQDNTDVDPTAYIIALM